MASERVRRANRRRRHRRHTSRIMRRMIALLRSIMREGLCPREFISLDELMEMQRDGIYGIGKVDVDGTP